MIQQQLSPVMFAGTGSDVGKSVIAAAFCRIFYKGGYSPSPFKAQNMALNSYVTKDGLEIGRAQAMQAEAACIACSADMNPILLKPSSDNNAQVVVNGKPIGNRSAWEYFRKEGRNDYIKIVQDAYDRLSSQYNPIVLEGAGSIAEINLKDLDLVNMSMAKYAGAKVILIADIDRGGVFASVYGSIMLLEPEERAMIKGIIINKFRGDIRLFEDGRKMIEDLCKVPVLGVIPYFKDIYIEEEDSVCLENKRKSSTDDKINVAVVLLRHMSNFTDFNALDQHPDIHLYYAVSPDDLKDADIIILPGTKNTIEDCKKLHESGMVKAILEAYKEGKSIVGICGGYQIMGRMIYDPLHIEGDTEQIPGLGLLPTETTMNTEKHTSQTNFRILQNEDLCEGYEIHNGATVFLEDVTFLNKMADGSSEGCFLNEKCIGTYMHGIFDNNSFIELILKPFRKKESGQFNYKDFKEKQYDLLAEHIEKHIDMNLVYEILK